MDFNIIKGKRAVAYFDVLGFKQKVQTESIDEISKNYERAIDLTYTFSVLDAETGKLNNNQFLLRYIFSDSIFIVAKDDTDQAFTELVSYVWRLMQALLATSFPVRGAITYDEIYINRDKNIFVGLSIVNAVTLESNQNWIGTVVDKTAIERYKNIFKDSYELSSVYSALLPVYGVPLKDGSHPKYHVINWRVNIISEFGIKTLFKNPLNDRCVEIKIQNTLAFSKFIVDNGFAYFNNAMVPARYRSFYISSREPFMDGLIIQNGDEY